MSLDLFVIILSGPLVLLDPLGSSLCTVLGCTNSVDLKLKVIASLTEPGLLNTLVSFKDEHTWIIQFGIESLLHLNTRVDSQV